MGLPEMAGAGPTVTIGEHTLVVRARIVRHLGLIAAEMKKERGNPLDYLRDMADILNGNDNASEAIINKAFDAAKEWAKISLFEIMDYIVNSWHGNLLAMWLAVRDNDIDKWTFEHFTEVFCDEYERRMRLDGIEDAEEWMASIGKAIDQASGSDELGNSHGSPQPSA